MHAEPRPGGTLLRMTDVHAGRSVEVTLDADACRSLGRYLTAAPR